MSTKSHPDWEIIESHGGAARVARKLGYVESEGGTQRVFNWKARGIPAHVKLAHPFLRKPKVTQARPLPKAKAA